RVHLYEPACLHLAPPPIPFAPLRPITVGLHILGVPRPIGLPISAILRCPRVVRSRLLVPVVGILLPLGSLPAPAPRAPTLLPPAILVIANPRTRPKRLAAPGTALLLHHCASAPANLGEVR